MTDSYTCDSQGDRERGVRPITRQQILRWFRRLVRWALLVVTLLYVLTGFGITEYRTIESVTFDGQTIYPYDTVVLTESDLYEKDCEYLIKTMKGPLMLENDPDLFILVGTMYEKGICTRQNVQQAYTYYRRAGKPGMKKYNDLRRRSS